MSNIEIRGSGWYCPKCGHFRRIRGIYKGGIYQRRCRCGFRVALTIEMKSREQWHARIVAAEEIEKEK